MRTSPAELRRHRQREEARRAILDATEALLLDAGWDGFSMRRLAERCGYTTPTIYHYFEDKPALIDALLEERFAGLLRRVRRVPRVDDPAEHMRALSRAFVDFGMRNPTFYRLLTMPRPAGAAPPRSAEAAREVFEEPIHQLAREGKLHHADVEAVTQTAWVLLHGLISLRLSRPEHPWSPDLVEVALETLIRGTVRPTPAADHRRRA